MSYHMNRRPGVPAIAIAAVFLVLIAFTAGAAPVMQTTSLAGTIASVRGNLLTLTADDGGAKTVAINPDTLVLHRVPAVLGDIRQGDALGVAAKRGADGSLTATSINIFSPELWNVVRKGQWPMESGEIMTNAVVSEYTAESVQGRTLTMKYTAITASIAVPQSTDIHKMITVQLSDLSPGMKVSVRGAANPDGTIAATSIAFAN